MKIRSLKMRFFLLFTGLGILVSLGVGLVMYNQYSAYIKNSYQRNLADVLHLVEKQYPILSDPAYLVQQGTAGTDEYWDIITHLHDITTSFELAYIYFLWKDGNQYRFVLEDNLTRDTKLEVMFSIYDEVPPELDDTYRSRRFHFSETPYTDEYGTFVSAYTPIFKNGAVVGVLGADYEVSFVKAFERRALIALLISLVLAVGVSVLLAFGVSSSLIKPIHRANEVLKTIAAGDLTQNVEDAGHDEIGEMMRLLNLTQKGIKALVLAIRDKAQGLSSVGNELSTMTSRSVVAINKISVTTQDMKARVITQAASVTETNETMEAIATGIGDLNRNIEKQAESVSRSSAAIEELTANITSVTQSLVQNEQNVQELAAASEKGHSALQQVSMDIQDVAQESEHLLEINKVIQNIASQTNLLSMNAAIEAAHAGEMGKGFAVVAEEIRKLAESSSVQAKTVSAVLKKIKGALDGISVSTAAALNHFKAIDAGMQTVSEQEGRIRNAMEEQDAGSKDILSTIVVSKDITQKVQSSSKTMMSASKEVMVEGKNFERLTSDLTGIAEEMRTINTSVIRIQDISQKNKQSIEVLVQEITKFKVV